MLEQSGGRLFTVSAPSGAGKTSLVRGLVERDSQIRVSVSHTTRPMRPGEIDGINYHFIDRDTFTQRQHAGEFLESAEVFGNLYGTSHQQINDLMGQGFDVILEIDWQGAAQIRRLIEDACSIFILPPSRAALRERLEKRGQDDSSVIEKRMAEATAEMSHYAEADYLVLNDDFDTALNDLRSIFLAARTQIDRATTTHESTLSALLDTAD